MRGVGRGGGGVSDKNCLLSCFHLGLKMLPRMTKMEPPVEHTLLIIIIIFFFFFFVYVKVWFYAIIDSVFSQITKLLTE